MTDDAVLSEVGSRLERHRLNRNLTQADLATEAGVSVSTVQRLERGESTQLKSWFRILRVLDLLPALDNLVPELPVSPISLADREGQARKHAYPKRQAENAGDWTWGDDA